MSNSRSFLERPEKSALDLLSARVDELRERARQIDPLVLAARTGGDYDSAGGLLRLPLWLKPVSIALPDLIGRDAGGNELSASAQALLLYHLVTSTGAPLSDRWISLGGLPDGLMYNAAFQGYSGDKIARTFGADLSSFERACEKQGGIRVDLSDAAYRFQPLPRVPILVTCWLGDEEFPSACKILFDASARHHLPTDVCAILGGQLAGKLTNA
jgi:hypothetical protein